MMSNNNTMSGSTKEPASDPLLTSFEVAELVGVDEKSLRHQRLRRRRNPDTGMPWEMVSGRPMYRLSVVRAFYMERTDDH